MLARFRSRVAAARTAGIKVQFMITEPRAGDAWPPRAVRPNHTSAGPVTGVTSPALCHPTGCKRSTVISLNGPAGSPGAYGLDGVGQPVNWFVRYSSQATP